MNLKEFGGVTNALLILLFLVIYWGIVESQAGTCIGWSRFAHVLGGLIGVCVGWTVK